MTDIRKLNRGLIQNTLKLRAEPGAVKRKTPDHFSVVGLRGTRRVNVRRRGDQWRCSVDKKNSQDNPCSHILVVLIHEGIVDLPNTANTVWRKGHEPRDHGLETRAWELVPTRLPALLAKLLRQGLPVIAPDPAPNPRGGEPIKPPFPKFYQAITRAGFLRKSLRCARGDMANHAEHNPYGSVGIATQSRFLAKDETETALEKLQLLTLWPVREFETLVHPDGTGLTEQHFSAYFDERYAKDRKKRDAKQKGKRRQRQVGYLPPVPDTQADDVQAAVAGAARDAVAASVAEEVEAHAKRNKPREHHWSYAEILWTYRYTMVAAIRTAQQQFGEAPWLIPLLERARLMLDVKELGGDKAYDANYIYRYAKEHGIDAQIKVRRTPFPSYSTHRKKYRKAHMIDARLDPVGFSAKANRRNNAETGNHAFKAILGDQIYSKNPVAQRCEVLCMCIAYNLTRLVLLELERGIEADFAGGAELLRRQPWVPLQAFNSRFRGRASPGVEESA